MRFYESSAEIAAQPAAVWSVLTDASGYADWDSGVVRVEGRIAPGEKIRIVSELDPNRAHPVKVTEFEPGRRMSWTGGMPLGLFKGVRRFELTPDGDGRTTFRMREEFTGPMLPLIWRSLPDFGPAFEQFARGLKKRAETGAA
jgi:hypothetical protein